MKYGIIILVVLISYSSGFGQNRLSLSTPVIWSKVQVLNNWSPPTAVHRINQYDGTALGYGVNLTYSFSPTILFRSKYLKLNIGGGYFRQRFDIQRPFNYDSFLYRGYLTDHYSYHCFQGLIGTSYSRQISEKYSISGNLTYNWLHSFRQDYTPTPNRGYDFDDFTQINHKQIDYGKMLIFAAGINRNLGNNFSLGLAIQAPLYTRWRNDMMFNDDPSEFLSPKFSVGSQLTVVYHLKNNSSLNR